MLGHLGRYEDARQAAIVYDLHARQQVPPEPLNFPDASLQVTWYQSTWKSSGPLLQRSISYPVLFS